MSWVSRRKNGNYTARYRGPDKIERSRTFPLKRDALAWLAAQETARNSGDWTDPRSRKVLVKTVARGWLAGKANLKPSSKSDYEYLWKNHLEPRWGSREIGSITTTEATEWASELRQYLGVSRARRAIMSLRQIMELAVEDRKISRNPISKRISAGRQPRSEPRGLSHQQVVNLVQAAGPEWGPIIEVLAQTGLRVSEANALKVRNVNLHSTPPEIAVVEARVRVSRQGLVSGTPKSWENRKVPLTANSVRAMRVLISNKSGDEYVFTLTGAEPADPSELESDEVGTATSHEAVPERLRRLLPDFCVSANIDPPITPHDLRDTAATLAIQAGASVKTVQAMLGHASAKLTLDRYTSWFPSDFGGLVAKLELAQSQHVRRATRSATRRGTTKRAQKRSA